MRDEQVLQIDEKITELELKKNRTRIQAVADYIEGYIEGLKWCKANL